MLAGGWKEVRRAARAADKAAREPDHPAVTPGPPRGVAEPQAFSSQQAARSVGARQGSGFRLSLGLAD